MQDYNRSGSHGGGGEIPWFVVILAFVFFWPAGLFLLIRKLSEPTGQRGETAWREQASGGAGMYAGAPRTVEKRQKKKKEPGHKVLGIIGAVALGIGIVGGLGQFEELMYWFGTEWFLEELWNFLTMVVGFGGTGAALLAFSSSLRRREGRCKRYLAYIGKSKVVSLDEMAAAVGVPYQKVVKDLENLMDRGELEGAYLDYSTRELVFSGAVRQKKQKPEPQPETPPKAEPVHSEYEKIVDEIVALNKDIENEEVSRKIDRIEYVTRRIFQCVQEHPEKKPQLDKFMNYYLPNTLKMLRAYAQFEEQEVEGENIAAAMKDIEDIMDKLVAGFEKQLDRLFEADAVDISTDITVLEGMLAKDGFTGEEDFKLR